MNKEIVEGTRPIGKKGKLLDKLSSINPQKAADWTEKIFDFLNSEGNGFWAIKDLNGKNGWEIIIRPGLDRLRLNFKPKETCLICRRLLDFLGPLEEIYLMPALGEEKRCLLLRFSDRNVSLLQSEEKIVAISFRPKNSSNAN